MYNNKIESSFNYLLDEHHYVFAVADKHVTVMSFLSVYDIERRQTNIMGGREGYTLMPSKLLRYVKNIINFVISVHVF